MTYKNWMIAVDQEIQKIAIIGLYDLPDCTYYDWYEADYTPKEAAKMALENTGFPFEII